MPARIPTQDALHALFHPRAVAVIGASDDTTKHGNIVLTNLPDTGFPGGVYGIRRRLRQVDAVPCFPDLALGKRLQAIDVNPVILGLHGAVAVDALVIPLASPSMA